MVNWLKDFKRSKSSLMATVVGLLFAFSAAGQSTGDTTAHVILDNPDYLLFTWRGDTLTTGEFAAFFDFMGKADSIGSVLLEAQITFFLKQNLSGVNKVNESMQRSFFVTLDDYAKFCALHEKRWRIIKE